MKNHIVIPEREFSVHEECGIFGIASKEKRDIAKDIYFGLFALQHRGQESAGIAVQYDEKAVAYYKNMGLVSEVFNEENLSLMPRSRLGIGHVRYSTTGSSNVINAQPVVFYGRHGRMALAHNGNIVNAAALKEKLLKEGHIFQSSSDSEMIAALINYHSGGDLEKGIIAACQELVGAFALVIMAAGRLYAVRDPNGLRPLIMGEKDGDIIIASESCALDAIEASFLRDIKPGEILNINLDGEIKSIFLERINRKSCIFEYVYLARSDSVIDGVSVYDARYECGRRLAAAVKIDADIVAGVPDSALVSARGYSDVSGIPYVDALSKNRYIGRTFIQPNQAMRENSVKIKLNAFRSNIKGKRLILIDDSIVRGTTSKKIIKLLRQSGAKEVHMLIASPIVKYPCYFGVDMDSPDQLIGGHRTLEEIRQEIGADSLNYLSIDDLNAACQSQNGECCTGCFDGKYPIDIAEINCNKSIFE